MSEERMLTGTVYLQVEKHRYNELKVAWHGAKLPTAPIGGAVTVRVTLTLPLSMFSPPLLAFSLGADGSGHATPVANVEVPLSLVQTLDIARQLQDAINAAAGEP